ncbi:MAG: Fic family protein, partial [Alphaproteobacteria bacterium]
MRVPNQPPDRQTALDAILKEDSQRVRTFFENSKPVDDKGRYLHWDELRFKPLPDGLSAVQWWAATKLARHIIQQPLALKDKFGNPFRYCEPQVLKVILRFLDMNAGGALGADATAVSAHEGRAHLTRSLAEEPFASSFIEGAATTRQIAKQLIFEGRQPKTRDELMVLNNFRAMEFVKQFRGQKLRLDFLLELHNIVTKGTMDDPADSGRIRTNDDIQVVDDTNGEILHQPPPAADLLVRLELLFEFANDDSEGAHWVHPLLKAMMLHFMLAYEHPFVDGNGRVARALFYWYALKQGYWLLEYVSISSVIAEAKIEYGRSFLFVESDESDLTYFLCNQANTLKKAVERLHSYVERKKKEVQGLEVR